MLPALALAAVLVNDVSFNGSVAARAQVTAPSEDSLVSTKDLPILENLNEVNLKGKAELLDKKLRFAVDTSAFVPFGGLYGDAKGFDGAVIDVAEHDVSSLQPFIALSEYWASAEPVEHLVLTVGKKRTTWGPGLAYSPTDILNPPRDPTDPSLQRAGFLQARVDVPFERFTVTALFAPEVLDAAQGIPTAVLRYAHKKPDDEAHYAAALRAYALVADADLNAWVLWTNRYGDDLANEPRFAFTFSKNVIGANEIHGEVLVQEGSARLYANDACVNGGVPQLARCVLAGKTVADTTLLHSTRIIPKILLGWRYMPDDGSIISLEYLYQADGYTRTEFGDVERLAALATSATRGGIALPDSGFAPSSSSSSSASASEAPNRIAFDPRRRHYLFFTYTKPQVLDDFTLSFTAITPLEDLSVLASASVTWQAQEWLQLSLFGFAPVSSPARVSADLDGDPLRKLYDAVPADWRGFVPRGALVDTGTRTIPVGEYDAVPFRALVMLEARAFF